MIQQVIHGDCLEVLPQIESKSIDMILCDLPYGITANPWDSIIPLDKLWAEYSRVIKENGAIVLFGTQPFTTTLVNSNPKLFRYEIIWDKGKGSNFQHARRMIMKSHENILVFYKKLPTYNPQKTAGVPYVTKPHKRGSTISGLQHSSSAANIHPGTINEGDRYPLSVQRLQERF